MALTISGGDIQHKGGTWQTSESLTQATGTTPQKLDVNVDVSLLGMGTASGDNNNNLYALTSTSTEPGRTGDAVEGMEKFIMATATGEAALFIEMATGRLPFQLAFMSNGTATVVDALAASATGNWVFGVDGDFMHVKYMNGAWMFMGGQGCTQATAT